MFYPSKLRNFTTDNADNFVPMVPSSAPAEVAHTSLTSPSFRSFGGKKDLFHSCGSRRPAAAGFFCVTSSQEKRRNRFTELPDQHVFF